MQRRCLRFFAQYWLRHCCNHACAMTEPKEASSQNKFGTGNAGTGNKLRIASNMPLFFDPLND